MRPSFLLFTAFIGISSPGWSLNNTNNINSGETKPVDSGASGARLPLSAANADLVFGHLPNSPDFARTFDAKQARQLLKKVPSGQRVRFQVNSKPGATGATVAIFDLASGLNSLVVRDTAGNKNVYRQGTDFFFKKEEIPDNKVRLFKTLRGIELQIVIPSSSGAGVMREGKLYVTTGAEGTTSESYTLEAESGECCSSACQGPAEGTGDAEADDTTEEPTPTESAPTTPSPPTVTPTTTGGLGTQCCDSPQTPGVVSWAPGSFANATKIESLYFLPDDELIQQNKITTASGDDGTEKILQWRTDDSIFEISEVNEILRMTTYGPSDDAAAIPHETTVVGGHSAIYPVSELRELNKTVIERIPAGAHDDALSYQSWVLGELTRHQEIRITERQSGANSESDMEVENILDGVKEGVYFESESFQEGYLEYQTTKTRSLLKSDGSWETVSRTWTLQSDQYGAILPQYISRGGVTELTYYYHANGDLKAILHGDGSWQAFTPTNSQHENFGDDLYLGPFLDTPFPGAGFDFENGSLASYRVTGNSWAVATGTNTRKTFIQGIQTEQSAITFVFGDGEASSPTETSYTDRNYFEEGQYLETIIARHAADHADPLLRGKISSRTNPDQTVVKYHYERGTWDGSSFTAETDGPHLKESRLHTTVGFATGVANRSSKEISIYDGQGKLLANQLAVCAAPGNFEIVSSQNYFRAKDYTAGQETLDVTNEQSRTIRMETKTMNGAQTVLTDETGQTTTTDYDSEGRVRTRTETSALGLGSLTTTWSYQGLTTTETTRRGDPDTGFVVSSSETVRDLRGRVVSVTDSLGRVTAYNHPTPLIREIEKLGTTISQRGRYLDGRSKFSKQYHLDSGQLETVSSTAVVIIGSTGGIATTTTTAGAPTVIKTLDWLGRVKTSASNGLVTSYQYNTKGQLESVTRGTLPPQRFSYDDFGFRTQTSTDVVSGSPETYHDVNTDRVTEQSRAYTKLGGVWWEETVTKRWEGHANHGGVKTLTAQSRNLLEMTDDTMMSQTVTRDQNGVSRTTTVAVDSALREVTTTVASSRYFEEQVTRVVDGYPVSRTSFYDGAAESWHYQFINGQLVSTHTSARGGRTVTTQNPLGETVSIQNPVNDRNVYAYHPAGVKGEGQLASQTNSRGETTTYGYDLLGQRISVAGASYPVIYGYDLQGRMITMETTTDAGPSVTRWFYHPTTGKLAHKISHWDGFLVPDANGNIPLGKGTSYQYDNYGRLTKRLWARENGAGTRLSTTYAYSTQGDLIEISDNELSGQDLTPAVSYSDFGASGQAHVITQEGIGSVTRTIAAIGSGWLDHSFVYSSTHAHLPGRKLKETNFLAYGWEYRSTDVYEASNTNEFGNWQSILGGKVQSLGGTSPVDLAVSFGDFYRGTHVPKTKTFTVGGGNTDLTTTHHLDLAGRTASISSKAGSTNGLPDVSTSYTYDRAGRRTHATREDGTTWNYQYNERGEVISGRKLLTSNEPLAGQQFTYAYDEIGNRTTASFGGNPDGDNLRTISYSVNHLNQYSSITHAQKGNVLGLAPAASSVEVRESAAGPNLPVDRQGDRFRAETGTTEASGTWREAYVGLDGNGPTLQGGQWIPAGNVTPSYDADGNLTFDGRWLYKWDAHNRLVKLDVATAALAGGHPHLTLEFAYDHQGRRMKKKVTDHADSAHDFDHRFLYDGWNLIAEYEVTTGNALSLIKTHQWGNDLSQTPQGAGGVGGLLATNIKQSNGSWKSYLPSFDGNGNIIAWTSGTGAILQRIDYDPFGNTLSKNGNFPDEKKLTFGFSTKYEDAETGLLYYGYRYYDPKTGRWPSRDPIEEDGGVNLYGMVGNDTVDRWDYLGLLCDDCDGKDKGATKVEVSEPFKTFDGKTPEDVLERLTDMGWAGAATQAAIPQDGIDAGIAGAGAVGLPSPADVADAIGKIQSVLYETWRMGYDNQRRSERSVDVTCYKCGCCFAFWKEWKKQDPKRYTSPKKLKRWKKNDLDKLKEDAKELCNE